MVRLEEKFPTNRQLSCIVLDLLDFSFTMRAWTQSTLGTLNFHTSYLTKRQITNYYY